MKSQRKLAALVREYARDLLREPTDGTRRLRIFDFDDTLVLTDAKIWVTTGDGNRFSLTPGEFALYEKNPGEVMDFTEFSQLINPRVIGWMGQILRMVYDRYSHKGSIILSARTAPEPIVQFLTSVGMSDIEVKALNNADPTIKAGWVDTWIRERELDHVEFFDDSHKNVAAVRQLRELHPNVNIVVRHVDHESGFVPTRLSKTTLK